MTNDVRQVVATLNRLDHLGIIKLLEEKRITGMRFVTSQCPLARYIYAETSLTEVFVNIEVVIAPDCGTYDLSTGPARFIAQFDAGNIPQLLDRSRD